MLNTGQANAGQPAGEPQANPQQPPQPGQAPPQPGKAPVLNTGVPQQNPQVQTVDDKPWFKDVVPDALHGDVASYETMEALIEDLKKSKASAQYVDNEGSLKLPKEGAPKEEWDKVWEALGRPKDASLYLLDKKTTEDHGLDEDFRLRFQNLSFENGLTKKQADNLYFKVISEFKARDDGVKTKEAVSNQRMVGELKAEWGHEFDRKLAMAQDAFDSLVPNQADKKLFQDTGLHSHPAVIKLLAKVKEMSEDPEVLHNFKNAGYNQNRAMTPALARKKIAEIQNSDEYRSNDPRKKALARKEMQTLAQYLD